MTCPPIGDSICKNSKFKPTISSQDKEGFKSFFKKKYKLKQEISSARYKIKYKEVMLLFYYRINNRKEVGYKIQTFAGVSNYEKYPLGGPATYVSLNDFRSGSAQSNFTASVLNQIISDIKNNLGAILNKSIQSTQQTQPSKPTPKRENRGTTPAPRNTDSSARGATGPTSSTGTSTSTQQSPATVPGSGATGAIGALQDTGYLNTSRPKDFPLINQPNGQYKPLSEVSRFVFDASLASSPIDIEREYVLETNTSEDNRVTGRYSNTNRKRFGANLAVLNKLESVEFHEGKVSDDKRDYIAYLIPYGSPGIESNPSSTVSTQVPAPDSSVPVGPNNIPGISTLKGDSKIISEKNPEAFDLFISAQILTSIRDEVKLSREELTKIYTKQWMDLIDSKQNDLIIDSIDIIYSQENYPNNKNEIIKNRLRLQPLLYKKIISNLERDLNSLSKKETPKNILSAQQNLDVSQITQADIKSTSFKINRESSVAAFNNTLNPDLFFLNPDSPNITFGYIVMENSNRFNTMTITGRSADPVESSNKKDAGTSGIDPSLKVWQFLYNPQSITIDVKADYAESNTWGATDDGQSGQSVIWQRNRNPVMRLDEVVLNGYIHGKKVGQLEEGLFALLMSRDGPGQIEPTVWEFVWGKRRFGPCIINNIQVVEKQWEAGEVLTATVSFELTQIPKWQIIDSTVKFYDPTAMATFASAPTGEGAAGASGATTDGGGGGGSAATTSSDSPGGGGREDPCRASFNGIIDGARSKSISNYLFKCSKLTSPRIDLYKDTTPKNKEEKVDNLITSILDKLDKQCNSFNGGKTPIISTQKEGEEYKKQGFAVLKEAVKERERCVNQSKLRGKSVSPAQVKDLLKSAYEGSKFDSFSFGLLYDPNKFTNYYESVYNRVSNYFSIDDLAKRIDINSFIIFSKTDGKWNSSSKNRKCRIKTIRDKYFSNKDSLLQETKTCHQQIWLVILQEMSKKNIVFDSSVSKNFTNTDIFIELFLSKNIPKEILIKSGLFVSNQKRFLLPNLDLK